MNAKYVEKIIKKQGILGENPRGTEVFQGNYSYCYNNAIENLIQK